MKVAKTVVKKRRKRRTARKTAMANTMRDLRSSEIMDLAKNIMKFERVFNRKVKLLFSRTSV